MKILLIEGDQHYAQWLSEKLDLAGFRIVSMPVELGFNCDLARSAAASIIDADREGTSIAQVICRARSTGHDAPVMVISGREDWRMKVDCLDAGADDFLVKPIHSEEISARLRAMIRRSAGRACDRFAHGSLVVDIKARCAWLGGTCLELTRNEFRLLSRFLMQPEQIHTFDEIRQMIQQPGSINSSNAVEVLVARLRRKIGKDMIRTVRGLGYRVAPLPDNMNAVEIGFAAERLRA